MAMVRRGRKRLGLGDPAPIPATQLLGSSTVAGPRQRSERFERTAGPGVVVNGVTWGLVYTENGDPG